MAIVTVCRVKAIKTGKSDDDILFAQIIIVQPEDFFNEYNNDFPSLI